MVVKGIICVDWDENKGFYINVFKGNDKFVFIVFFIFKIDMEL